MRQARIETTPEGQVPVDGGWFILNLGEMAWESVPGFGAWLGFDAPDADPSQPRVGVHVHVLAPGEANGYYHAEAAQEGFLVLSGECIAVVEGEERRMRRWDYFHSPPGTEHITIGAGEEPCAILMFGSPDPRRKVEWIANETAARYGASVAKTTGRDTEAYGELPDVVRVRPPEPFAGRRAAGRLPRIVGDREEPPMTDHASLFDDIDSMEPDRFARHLADDVVMRFGNAEPVHGRAAVRDAWAGFCEGLSGVRHDLVEQWSVPPATIVEAQVTYTRRDGSQVTVPVVTIYRASGELIDDYRIFIDLAPLFADDH